MNMATKEIMERIKEMDPRERRSLIASIIREGFLSEDEEDALLISSRKNEPSMPADEFFTKLESKRASNS